MKRNIEIGLLVACRPRTHGIEVGVSNKEVRWATAYVHANHPSGLDYRFSTHTAYVDPHRRPGWLSVEKGLAAFGDESDYVVFMRDHATRAELNARFF